MNNINNNNPIAFIQAQRDDAVAKAKAVATNPDYVKVYGDRLGAFQGGYLISRLDSIKEQYPKEYALWDANFRAKVQSRIAAMR